LLHCHLPGDHLIAALARRGMGADPHRVAIVRSLYDPAAPGPWPRALLAFGQTDGVVAPTPTVAAEVRSRFQIADRAVVALPPPVETDVFTPRGNGADHRADWGLAPEDFVVGLVARIQPHRRFELLWEVVARVFAAQPRARFVLLGRGDRDDVERLCFEPVDRLGLGRRVLFPGYRYDDGYPPTLRTLDAFLFLVPGSDGTCRAVREAMACGLPVVSTDLGILPELVRPAGSVAVPAHAEVLADELLQLAVDPGLRAVRAQQARTFAREQMDPARHARQVLELYERSCHR
jgi:glycosyltransferase involved in cell wall biosynthesis